MRPKLIPPITRQCTSTADIFLRDKVFSYELGPPTIALLARNLGTNAASSSMNYDLLAQVINAGSVSLEQDLRKLVDVSFLYAREVARNTVLLYLALDGKGIEDVAKVNGSVPYAYSDIILDSDKVASLSVKVLVITPSLYRCLDEAVSGQKKWSGRLSMTPYIKEMGGDLVHDENQQEEEPFVVPMILKVGMANDDEKRHGESDSRPLETGSVSEMYDLRLTNKRQQSTSTKVSWGNVSKDKSN
ncbi:hypothetical protein K440DRAFT_642559 [Wilcoxina mikolae CBS 423.85]|nr:hypothetical protein K440DRAFT_642559 [Wilcoxina mikolae CBS 423.85]